MSSNLAQAKEYTVKSVISLLQDFHNNAPIAAEIALDTRNETQHDKIDIKSQSTILTTVHHNNDGLSVLYPPQILNKIEDEAQKNEKNADSPMPTQAAAASLNTREILTYLEANKPLIRRLKNATLVRQEEDTYKGNPADLLVFSVEPQFSQRDKKYIKEYEAILKLWMSKSSIPIATEAQFSMKGRAFLVITFSGEETEIIEYQTYQDRLVATSKRKTRKNKGGGESGNNTSHATVRVIAKETE